MGAVTDPALEARVLAWRTYFGLVEKAEIETWADAQILMIENPANEILGLAFARRLLPEDILHELRALGGKEERPSEICLALASIDPAQIGVHHLKAIMRKLSDIGSSLVEDSDEARLLARAWPLTEELYFDSDNAQATETVMSNWRSYLATIREHVARLGENDS